MTQVEQSIFVLRLLEALEAMQKYAGTESASRLPGWPSMACLITSLSGTLWSVLPAGNGGGAPQKEDLMDWFIKAHQSALWTAARQKGGQNRIMMLGCMAGFRSKLLPCWWFTLRKNYGFYGLLWQEWEVRWRRVGESQRGTLFPRTSHWDVLLISSEGFTALAWSSRLFKHGPQVFLSW